MGPNIKSVERTSQATPFAGEFLKYLQGQLSNAFATPTGTAGSTPGQSAQQYTNFQQKLGGINTAGSFTDETPALLSALTARSNATTDRNAAALREGNSALGNRFGSSAARGEGLLRAESGLNLDQLLASVMIDRANALQGARQFDAQANIEAVNPLFNLAGLGIIPNEVIASPGVGQQILTGGLQALGTYLGGGGGFGGLGKLFGGRGGPPQMPPSFPGLPNSGGLPATNGGQWINPTFMNDPFTQRG